MRIPEQVFVRSPQLCTHSAVRDPSRFPFLCLSCSHTVLVPSPHRSWVQVLLYSTLFALRNLRLATGIFGISLPFPPSHFCRLPTVVSFSLSLFITVSLPPEPSQYFCSSSLLALYLSTSPICISHKPFPPHPQFVWS